MPSPGGASLAVRLAPNTSAILGPRRGPPEVCAERTGLQDAGLSRPRDAGWADSAAPARKPEKRASGCGTGAAAGARPPPSAYGLPALDASRIWMLCDSKGEAGFGEKRGIATRRAQALP